MDIAAAIRSARGFSTAFAVVLTVSELASFCKSTDSRMLKIADSLVMFSSFSSARNKRATISLGGAFAGMVNPPEARPPPFSSGYVKVQANGRPAGEELHPQTKDRPKAVSL